MISVALNAINIDNIHKMRIISTGRGYIHEMRIISKERGYFHEMQTLRTQWSHQALAFIDPS